MLNANRMTERESEGPGESPRALRLAYHHSAIGIETSSNTNRLCLNYLVQMTIEPQPVDDE